MCISETCCRSSEKSGPYVWHVLCNLFHVPVLRRMSVAWLTKRRTRKFASFRVVGFESNSSLMPSSHDPAFAGRAGQKCLKAFVPVSIGNP